MATQHSSALRTFVLIAFYGYAVMFVGSGLISMAGAHMEFAPFFGLDPSTWPDTERASMLNQYRFLRAIEVGFGLFCFRFREEIFSHSAFHQIFVGTLWLIPIARTLSVLIDGTPRPVFLGLMATEYALAALFTWYGTQRG